MRSTFLPKIRRASSRSWSACKPSQKRALVPRASETNGGIRSHAALAKHDLIDPARRHAGCTRKGVLADPHRAEEFLKQHFAGMNVGQGLHDLLGQW